MGLGGAYAEGVDCNGGVPEIVIVFCGEERVNVVPSPVRVADVAC